jgi:hypothetical protein
MQTAVPEGFDPPSLKLGIAAPADRQFMILDTNIMNFAVTSPGGEVVKKLNAEIESAQVVRAETFGFCMTPFQTLEVLGTKLPEIALVPKYQKGQSASDLVGSVIDEATAAYLALPELSQEVLEARATERRSYLPEEGTELFDLCILGPLGRADLRSQIASALAWDHGLKAIYPKAIARDVDTFLASLLLVKGHSNISRFRVAKRLWDGFYARARTLVPSAADEIDKAARAMKLKSRRDFLDCDLIHLACFGWFDEDVIVLTCDPPETILVRIAVYKGMVEAVAANAPDLDTHDLPMVRAGLIVRCERDGSISHIFPVQRVPTIV